MNCKALRSLVVILPMLAMAPVGCSLRPPDTEATATRAKALDLLEQGSALEQQGQYEPAIQRYLQARDLYASPQVYYRLGHSYAQINELETARQYLQKAVDTGPENSAAFYELVHVEDQLKAGAGTQAEAQAGAGKQVAQPTLPSSRPAVTLAQGNAGRGNAGNAGQTSAAAHGTAMAASQPVAASQPSAAGGKGSVRLSDVYRTLFGGQGGAAAANVPRAEAGPTFLADAKFHLDKGQAYLKAGKSDLAVAEFNEALARDPGNGQTRVLLAQAYQKLGDSDEAQKQLIRALQSDPKNAEALLALSEMDLSSKSSGQAQTLIEAVSRTGNNDPETQTVLGDLYLKLDRQEKAAEHYQLAHQLSPNDPKPLYKMGNLRRQVGDRPEARRYYQEALKLDPKFIPALNNLAFMANESGEYDQARGYLEQILQIDPRWAKAYSNLGQLYEQRYNNPAKAIEYYQKYLQLGGPKAEEIRQRIDELKKAK